MIWKKHGQIFAPQQFGLEYAKSPQAIVFQDFVRVYFSACKKDGQKLVSYVCFADFTKDFTRVLRIEKQIMTDGKLGSFDEHGIFPFSPVCDGGRIFAYTSGWSRRVSVSVDTAIGLAVSEDSGESFQRLGEGPVLTSSLMEPFLVVDGFVRRYENRLHMWYIYGKEWRSYAGCAQPERIYKIGHAVSDNGVDWQKEGKAILPDVLEDECQALPCVINFNGCYHMFFCYRSAYGFRDRRECSYRLGYAWSKHPGDWIRCDEKLNFEQPEDGWDSQMQCYPHVFTMDQKIYLLYNGNAFGKNGFGLAELEEM